MAVQLPQLNELDVGYWTIYDSRLTIDEIAIAFLTAPLALSDLTSRSPLRPRAALALAVAQREERPGIDSLFVLL